MLQINKLTKSFADKLLFDQMDFTIGSGEKIGLVGRNGSGKSTLFKIITHQLGYDDGEIIRPNSYKIGYLEQHISFTSATVLAESCTALHYDEKFDEYLAEKILFGLGFTKEDMQKDPQKFSGGFQIRIQLTKVLLQKPDLLLLDEPTNYLDIISLRWLAGFIKKFDGEVLIISHDRQFLDAVTTHTAMLTNKKIKKIEGRFAKLQAQMREEEEILKKTQKNQEKRVKELEQFITRFKSKASKAAQAQSKMKMLAKMEVIERVEGESNFNFDFNYRPISSKFIGDIKNLSFHYPASDKVLINDLSFSIKKNDRMAIIGKNGKGKTTLLKLLAQRLSPSAGDVSLASDVKIGFYSQIVTEELDENATIVEEIASANEDLSIAQIRNICGIIMFEGDDAFKLIKILSGGEKNRVSLGKILASNINLLLLDEPTNHLDV
ncbi:MAG: ABC transporter ATP-binding protein, partial [Bdellovibrionales bacterium RIFOXYC2_FULL_39_8]